MGSLQRIEMNNLKSIVNSNPNFLGGNNAVKRKKKKIDCARNDSAGLSNWLII